MRHEEWIALFNKIPEVMHDQVVLSLSTGIDVYIQRFLQLNDTCILLRGRLGGTDEGERVFLVPWPELKMIFFSRPVGDEFLFKVFGDLIGGVKQSFTAKKKPDAEVEQEEDEDEEPRPMPVRLPPTPAMTEAARPGSINVDDVKMRLLQPRKPPPRTETNKPGPGTRPTK